MKKFIKDEICATGKAPKEVFPMRYSESDDLKTDLVLLWHRSNNNGFSYQVCISLKYPVVSNNFYFIYIYDMNDDLIGFSIYNSHTKLPPVWNREYGGVDYLDYIVIQEQINKCWEDQVNFNVDYSLKSEGDFPQKSFFMVKNENAQELAEKGESYEILSVFAERASEDIVNSAMELKDKVGHSMTFYTGELSDHES